VRRLAFERVTTAVDREFDALVGSGAVGERAGNMGRAEAGTQAAPRVDEAATMTAAPGMAEVGVQAATTTTDCGTEVAGPELSLSLCSFSRASHSLAGMTLPSSTGHGVAAAGGSAGWSASGARGSWPGHGASAREELELLTGVTAEEIERRLESAQRRFRERNWGWGTTWTAGRSHEGRGRLLRRSIAPWLGARVIE
jgi:hypothetical protein